MVCGTILDFWLNLSVAAIKELTKCTDMRVLRSAISRIVGQMRFLYLSIPGTKRYALEIG